jgi:hypothetical protein
MPAQDVEHRRMPPMYGFAKGRAQKIGGLKPYKNLRISCTNLILIPP